MARKKTSTQQGALSECCHEELHWEQLAGMRLFREVDGRKMYRARCPKCLRSYDVDDGPYRDL